MFQGGSWTEADLPEGGRRGTAAVLFNRTCTQFARCQIYRRVIEESKLNPHPNGLPVIQVSEAPFPVCIMCPWMPDGNITQYTQTNPGADRLMLVCARRWTSMGWSTDYTAIDCTSVPWPGVPSRVGYSTR